jgi:protein-S-isoprenylcysteine O-methyltransferase Ste14
MKNASSPSGLARAAGLAYGWLAFAMTFAFFAYLVIFLGNMPGLSEPWVSPSVDVGPPFAPFMAALIDLGLVALFGLQHSAMARPRFKAWWTRIVPRGLERSTYVMAASLVGFVMVLFWQPIPLVIWTISDGVGEIFMWALFGLGWALLLASGLSFNILELLGVRQAHAWYQGRPTPPLTLKTSWLYDWMKHPMYAGVLLGLWMTPHMTAGHALMAGGFTLYILIAMRFEERDLSRSFGDAYQAWRSGCPHARPRPGKDARAAR